MGREGAPRHDYEFDGSTRDHALLEAQNRSAATGRPFAPNQRVEVHHILPVNEAIKRGVPPEIVKSKANAAVVGKGFEHRTIHREIERMPPEQRENYIAAIIWYLFEQAKKLTGG
jgi:hypothetical protein